MEVANDGSDLAGEMVAGFRALPEHPLLQDLTGRGAVQRVYFIKSGSQIKIGIAVDPVRRMASLQTAQAKRLRLLGTCAGGREKERELHDQFKDARMRGEWFKATPGLMARIAELIDKEERASRRFRERQRIRSGERWKDVP